MSTLLQNETDYQTREAVEDELRWTPQITDPAGVGVSVDQGVVTLTGEVPTYAQKLAVGKAALRTKGVTAIANHVIVNHDDSKYHDAKLARDAMDALRLTNSVPQNSVEVEVRNHGIQLTGTVDWEYQRQAAQLAVEHLDGAHGVINDIVLRPRVTSAETHAKIREALIRNATVDANHIVVTVDGTTVTLSGTVSSFAEKRQAAHAAWSSPHVQMVHDELRVAPI